MMPEGMAPLRRPVTNPGAWLHLKGGSRGANPHWSPIHLPEQGDSSKPCVSTPFSALSFSTFAPYISGAGSPAMEINDRRNKPFGPGGSTRRLHQNPPHQAIEY